MAGDWIKMRVGLTTNPHVLRIAERLLESPEYLSWAGLSWGVGGYPPLSQEEADSEKYVALRVTRYVAVTALLKFWGYANEHCKGDFVAGILPQDVIEITGVPGFSAALEYSGWAEFDAKKGGMRMPNFDEHNTGARDRSSVGAERQKRYRERKKEEEKRYVTRDVTVTEREEKRREEQIHHPTPNGGGGLPGFARFWETWPTSDRKQAKGKCLDAWKKAHAERVAADILAHVESMKVSPSWQRDGGQYVPAPLTYLNQRRWEGAEGADDGAQGEVFV